jgi:dihydrodipicolinate synthase/N-acetylneuraminate lyase
MERPDQSEFGIKSKTGELYMLTKQERILTSEVIKRTLSTAAGREFLVGRFGEEGLKTALTLLKEMGVEVGKSEGGEEKTPS